MATDIADSVQTTTSTTFVAMRSKAFTLLHDGGNYRILISCEFTINNKNDRAEVEVWLDDVKVEGTGDSFSPVVGANEPHGYMTMILAEQTSTHPLNNGAHTLSFMGRSVNGNTVSMRGLHLSVDKY